MIMCRENKGLGRTLNISCVFMYIGEDIKIGVYHVVAFVNTHMYLLYHHMHNRPDTKSVIIETNI